MQYRLIENSDYVCRRNDDGSCSFIPATEANRDWVEYQAWLDLGNTPLASDEDWE